MEKGKRTILLSSTILIAIILVGVPLLILGYVYNIVIPPDPSIFLLGLFAAAEEIPKLLLAVLLVWLFRPTNDKILFLVPIGITLGYGIAERIFIAVREIAAGIFSVESLIFFPFPVALHTLTGIILWKFALLKRKYWIALGMNIAIHLFYNLAIYNILAWGF